LCFSVFLLAYYLGFCCCCLLRIELSYEHFPKATEKTLDLIAKVGTQVGNGLDVTVKYIDDKTGNVASAKWNKLDKATQDQIRGGGRILSGSFLWL
jgi:hypothetical protein